jgi:hypothetical protein
MLTYERALEKLGRRNRRRIGHETWLEFGSNYHVDPSTGEHRPCELAGSGRCLLDGELPWQEQPSIDVRYHDTAVVTIHPDGCYTLRTGGWFSATTRKRIEEYAPVWIRGRLNRGGCLGRCPMTDPCDCRDPGGDWLVGVGKRWIEFREGMTVDSFGHDLDHFTPEVL